MSLDESLCFDIEEEFHLDDEDWDLSDDSIITVKLDESNNLINEDSKADDEYGPVVIANVELKPIFQILTEIVKTDLKLDDLIGIATPLINTIDISNAVGRDDRRSKTKLKLKLEKYRKQLIPIITSPGYQIKLQRKILGRNINHE